MNRIWNWLRRLWRGVPDHAKKPDYESQPWSNPEHDVVGDIQAFIDADRLRNRTLGPPPSLANLDAAYKEALKPPSDRDLMGEVERKVWEDIEGGPPKHEPIAYPPPAEPDTQQWITDQLQERTGGITRHPFDKTQYPTAPNAADQAARDYVNERLGGGPSVRAYFTHGYSMQRLAELKRMAERRDPSLTTEELQALRVRGIA